MGDAGRRWEVLGMLGMLGDAGDAGGCFGVLWDAVGMLADAGGMLRKAERCWEMMLEMLGDAALFLPIDTGIIPFIHEGLEG